MNIQAAIAKVVENQNLTVAQMHEVMQQLMTGNATDAQIGAFLVALRMKGETADELTGAATVMRELSTKVSVNGDHIVDIVGTGGDGLKTFNISTTCCFVVAAAKGIVAKHGNRSVSSTSGSADLLEAAGVNLNLSHEQVAQCIEQVGVGFMFAPLHHSAMKHAIGPRKELGLRSIFNLLGPMTNPAGAANQLLGVFSSDWLQPMAQVLKNLGSEHVMVVHSNDGMDEISICAPTKVCELKNGELNSYEINPEDYGLKHDSLNSLVVNSAEESLALVKSVLNNEDSAAKDIVILNAGAAIYCANLVDSIDEGITKAKEVIANGSAKQKLDDLVQRTQGFK
ncbi:MAG: anthranilate phosphoribosyltransferase [Gammaproteobacteria bacterium]|nr:anthranilate phosphoribosyltransferase [Gammaproteobacteria bacterium]